MKVFFAGLMAIALATPVLAQTAAPAPAPVEAVKVTLTTGQLFGYADSARDAGNFALAEATYRALATNPNGELRTEARFRLAMMLADRAHRPRDAAVELRRILDEKPKATRIRLELARVLAMLGNTASAARELRAAEATGLSPELEQTVRFFANALDARRPLGGNLEIGVAPDSNANHATGSATIDTVIGNLTPDQNARAHSALGLDVRGQGFVRIALSRRMDLLMQLSGTASLYRDRAFDDVILAPQIGPTLASGADRIAVSLGPAWRWYGLAPYSLSLGGSGDWLHPLGRRAQLRVDFGLAHIDYRQNALQGGDAVTLAAGVDRALSARLGVGVQLTGNRQGARDPGYATAGIGANTYLSREIGETTLTVTASYNHLEADQRLSLFPRRRIDNDLAIGIAGVFRNLRIGSIAPLARLKYEANLSSVTFYDFRRLSAELGIATAF